MAGCFEWQPLARIRFRLALPEIMPGIDQIVTPPLSKPVIMAPVGACDPGHEVSTALTRADTGRGLVAGLCAAFLAITADRLIPAGAARTSRRLGLGGADR